MSSDGTVSCGICKKPDEGNMVQCDDCDNWFHFACANVSAGIESIDWVCSECAKNKTMVEARGKEETNNAAAGNTGEKITGKYNASNQKNTESALQSLVDDLQKQVLQLQKEKYVLQSCQNATSTTTTEVTTVPTTSVHDISNALSMGTQANTNAQYKGVGAQSNYFLPATSTQMMTTGIKNIALQGRPLEHNECTGIFSAYSNPSTHTYANRGPQGLTNTYRAGAYFGMNYNLNNNSNFYRQEHGGGGCVDFRGGPIGDVYDTGERQSNYNLTAAHIHARQALSKELPHFSGKPEEWPIFISSYENSTRICGYTDDENLLRLQRALKGKALDYVRNQLMIPALVPDVISTLRTIFGRPEHIINSLLEKVHSSPDVNANKLETLVTFSLGVKNLTATITAAGLTSHWNNPMLLRDLIQKLPAQMRLDWAMYSSSHPNINLLHFSEWLSIRANAASTVITIPVGGGQQDEKRKAHRVGFHEENRNTEKEQHKHDTSRCAACTESHFIANCNKFKKMTYNDKWNVVNRMKLCRSCLKAHTPKFCKERVECGKNKCTAKHHILLHKPEPENDSAQQNVVAVHVQKSSNVLYRILPITIHTQHGKADIYALLDDGSGPTIIEHNVLKKLHVKGEESELRLRWTDGSVRVEENSALVDLQVSAQGKNKMHTLHDVRTVTNLDLPPQSLIITELAQKYKHLRGLPVQSYEGVVPQMIIGLSNKHVAMPMKFREGKIDEPAATKTRLGWTIYGVLKQNNATLNKQNLDNNLQLHICECNDDIALQKLFVENMKWEATEAKALQYDLKHDDDKNQLSPYVKRTGDHFTTKLLWRSHNISLPNNYEMANNRLECFEKKLNREPDLKTSVSAHINSMVEKQYIRKLNETEVDMSYKRKWYLPIFTVRNQNKNKTRLVWDAAAVYKGFSLNGCLDKGPDLLRPLTDILYNFRIGKIGICADIREMFHRISVDEEDQHSQRFLWRDCDNSRAPDVYVLKVMSFGASCSPSIAQYVRNKNAEEFLEEFPRAAKSILERHYVDDMMDFADSPQEAIQLAKDVKEVHKRGNFHIRGWVSNCKQVVEALGETEPMSDFCKAGRTIDQVVEPEKVLGLWWETNNDVFTFNTKLTKASNEILSAERLPTKRELLRLLMSIYDPQGFLSFYTIRIRILLQDIWRSAISWDDTIPEEFSSPWKQWLSIFKHVCEVKIPRCYFGNFRKDGCRVELHVFVDASESASAAVAYFRIKNEQSIHVSLVGSKAKVAPLRPISVPRMELTAAVLGSRLAIAIVKGHDLTIHNTHFYTDSKTVITWLRSDPRKYKQFVMFRIAEVQENSDIAKWQYIPSKQNVADAATKWKNTNDFSPTNSWFTGPDFLYLPREIWPEQELPTPEINTMEPDYNIPLQCVVQTDVKPFIDVSRFSKWERLERCVAYVKRFVENCKNKSVKSSPCLTADELTWSRHFLYRLAQTDAYKNEIDSLRKDPRCVLPKSSPLKKLSPFIDANEIIRMRGRLERAPIKDEAKNPIILPKGHKITQLIIDWYHRKYHHVHHDTVLNEIFQRFYIASLRRSLRSVRLNCMPCKMRDANPHPPEMGQLPEGRVAAYMRPFSYVGIDFFGPFLVASGRRTEKRYGVLFTCMTCRAVHIEVAHSLSMNSCVIAIRNFISRRGQPIEIFSDNGTNLVAAEKELREACAKLDFDALQERLTSAECKWSFIPPASPHMGGAWERMIRSVKNVLYSIVTPDTKLTDEKLYNLFVEVESIVNSRPLTYISLDTADQEALTPNHFLLGNSSGSKPPGKFCSKDEYVKSSWRHSQFLADMFWKRWVSEVLPTLTRRSKWFDHTKPIKKDDIVIIVDPNLPRHTWPKGVIISTHTARDGQVRSATVRTSTGEYHRPASKIAVLDIQQDSTDTVA